MTQETQLNFDQHDALVTFLRAVLAAPIDGEVFVAASPYPKKGSGAKSAMKQIYADTHEALASAVLDMSSNANDSYFALGRYVPHATELGRPGRQGGHVRALKSVWMDIDCGEAKASAGHGYASKKEAVAAMLHFVKCCSLPEPSYVIDSGGGIHSYWALHSEVAPDEWKRVAVMLKDMSDAHGFLADPARTADVASVMRAPFTRNHKLETPRDAKIKWRGAPVEFSTLEQALTLAHAQHFGQLAPSAPVMQPADSGNLLPRTHNQRPPETAEEISQVEAMLASVPADCDYPMWRNALWAIASTGWSCAEKLARKWSASAPGKFNEAAFRTVWKSFDPARGLASGRSCGTPCRTGTGWMSRNASRGRAVMLKTDVALPTPFAARFSSSPNSVANLFSPRKPAGYLRPPGRRRAWQSTSAIKCTKSQSNSTRPRRTRR